MAETGIILTVGVVMCIVAEGIKASSTPMAPYYLSGAVMLSLNFGIMIERLRTRFKSFRLKDKTNA